MDEYASIILSLAPAACYGLALIEGRQGRMWFYIGIALHIASLGVRTAELGRLPLSERCDTISVMALVTALAAWYYGTRGSLSDLRLSAMPLSAVLVLIALAHKPTGTLQPLMKTPWFTVHVLFYSVAYGFFGLAASAGAWAAVTGKWEYETALHRSAGMGWLLLTASLIAGSVWFYLAYGTYWLWTSKELWITITWMYYGLYLHARLMGAFKGRASAVIGALGFAVALFSYFGVGTIIPSPPVQY